MDNSDIITLGTGSINISDSTSSIPIISTSEALLNDSRMSPSGNGNPISKPYLTQPTSGQKLWASIILGFIFALVSSPAAYRITSTITGGNNNLDVNFRSLILHTLIFIVIIRIILW